MVAQPAVQASDAHRRASTGPPPPMSAVDRLDNFLPDVTEWRRDLHRHPELQYELPRTAAFVAGKLREFGVDEVHEGIGRSGVVGLVFGRSRRSGHVVGLRADMDALPIIEASGAEWASTSVGRMHACGHDGHTAMLLGAARALADSRDFDGTVALIFQPAEEGGAGALAMIEDGMMERFGIERVYGMHNLPGLPVGQFAIRPGPIMACADQFDLTVTGRGGHAAMPHLGVDTMVVACEIVVALQTIASRSVSPIESLVITVTTLAVDGDAYNVIPNEVRLRGTVRAFDESVRLLAKRRIGEIAAGVATAHGATAALDYEDGYPPTVNDADETAFVAEVARAVAGSERVDADKEPTMGAEDFSYMLNVRPGAFIFCGNGDSASLHHPEYDFDDEATRHGCAYWLTLVEKALPRPA